MADVRMDEMESFGTLTLSCNPETELSAVIIRGAYHFQVEPVELTSIEELDINQEYWQDYHVPTRQEYVHDTWLRTRATRESMFSYANDY